MSTPLRGAVVAGFALFWLVSVWSESHCSSRLVFSISLGWLQLALRANSSCGERFLEDSLEVGVPSARKRAGAVKVRQVQRQAIATESGSAFIRCKVLPPEGRREWSIFMVLFEKRKAIVRVYSETCFRLLSAAGCDIMGSTFDPLLSMCQPSKCLD